MGEIMFCARCDSDHFVNFFNDFVDKMSSFNSEYVRIQLTLTRGELRINSHGSVYKKRSFMIRIQNQKVIVNGRMVFRKTLGKYLSLKVLH